MSRMCFLEHAVRRGIGDHDGGEVVRDASRPWRARSSTSTSPLASQATTTTSMPTICAEAGLVPCAEEGIRQTLRCGSPRAAMIGADREQPGIFALRAGIRLQRDRVIAGDVAQPLFQPREHRVIAARLIGRRERMQAAELRPGQRDHFGGRVELHGAGAERDHGAVERQVAVDELAHVAQQLGLGAVRVEHRMGEEGAVALQFEAEALRAR